MLSHPNRDKTTVWMGHALFVQSVGSRTADASPAVLLHPKGAALRVTAYSKQVQTALTPGFGDAAEARIVTQEEIAGVEGLGFEIGSVDGNEEPVADHAAQKLDGAEGREIAAEGSIGGIRGLRKYKPKAIVARRFGVIAQHADEAVAAIDSEAGKHATHFGVQGRERIEDEGEGRLRFRLGGARHGVYGGR